MKLTSLIRAVRIAVLDFTRKNGIAGNGAFRMSFEFKGDDASNILIGACNNCEMDFAFALDPMTAPKTTHMASSLIRLHETKELFVFDSHSYRSAREMLIYYYPKGLPDDDCYDEDEIPLIDFIVAVSCDNEEAERRIEELILEEVTEFLGYEHFRMEVYGPWA